MKKNCLVFLFLVGSFFPFLASAWTNQPVQLADILAVNSACAGHNCVFGTYPADSYCSVNYYAGYFFAGDVRVTYYECNPTPTTPAACSAAGRWWNNSTGVCERVPDCSGRASYSDTPVSYNAGFLKKYDPATNSCIPITPAVANCPAGVAAYDQWTGQCVTALLPDPCPGQGGIRMYRQGHDAPGFFECVIDDGINQSCGTGYYFDSGKFSCQKSDPDGLGCRPDQYADTVFHNCVDVPKCKGGEPPHLIKPSSQNFSFFPQQTAPAYYFCDSGELPRDTAPTTSNCPAGFTPSPVDGVCVPVTPVELVPPPPDTSAPGNSGTGNPTTPDTSNGTGQGNNAPSNTAPSGGDGAGGVPTSPGAGDSVDANGGKPGGTTSIVPGFGGNASGQTPTLPSTNPVKDAPGGSGLFPGEGGLNDGLGDGGNGDGTCNPNTSVCNDDKLPSSDLEFGDILKDLKEYFGGSELNPKAEDKGFSSLSDATGEFSRMFPGGGSGCQNYVVNFPTSRFNLTFTIPTCSVASQFKEIAEWVIYCFTAVFLFNTASELKAN